MKNLLFIIIIASLTIWSAELSAQYICTEGDCLNGTGKKKVKDGTGYIQGKFKDGILQEGKVVFPNGNVFTGKFKDHKLVQGLKVFPNGSRLEGRFFEEVLVEGRITYEDGSSRLIKLRPY